MAHSMGVGQSEEINRGRSGAVGVTERNGGISHVESGCKNTKVDLEAHDVDL